MSCIIKVGPVKSQGPDRGRGRQEKGEGRGERAEGGSSAVFDHGGRDESHGMWAALKLREAGSGSSPQSLKDHSPRCTDVTLGDHAGLLTCRAGREDIHDI